MAKSVVIHAFGGSDQLTIEERDVPKPGAGEITVEHHAVGLNFIDVYQRTGLYPLALPACLGMEAAGVVRAVGDGVSHLNVGDRVAYAAQPPGAYAEARTMPAAHVCALPEGIDFETGAAMMLKGMTVHYLFHRTTPIKAGDTVLFHAASGGVGLIACQWAKSEGITLIGTAGSDGKCARALEHGASHCINYASDDFAAQVQEITGGAGVDVVMDSVGAATFEGSLSVLKPLGMMISFGNASGPVTGFDLGLLAAKGSLKITRPTLFTHIAQAGALDQMSSKLFEKTLAGDVRIEIGQRYGLDHVKTAHDDLESRKTQGSSVLTL